MIEPSIGDVLVYVFDDDERATRRIEFKKYREEVMFTPLRNLDSEF